MAEKCFICTTPYQIIAASAIELEMRFHADLLIVPQFSGAEAYAERARNTGIFSNVLCVDTSEIEAYKKRKNRLLYGLGIVKNYVFLDRIVKSMIGETVYKTVYISSQANIGRLISIYCSKRGAEIVFFDDGEGSYDNSKIYEAQGIDRLIRSFFFGKKSIGFSNKRKLYFPELYRNVYSDKDDVQKIMNWAENRSFLDCMNDICGYSADAQISEKYVLIDTIPSESFDSDGAERYEKLRALCADSLGEQMIVKKHPRDKSECISSVKVYPFSSIPFEIICANSDIGDKVLITAASTAVFIPKMLFDSEPVVIMLHRITGSRFNNSAEREKMIDQIRALYRDPGRIVIPESIAEFEEILQAETNSIKA